MCYPTPRCHSKNIGLKGTVKPHYLELLTSQTDDRKPHESKAVVTSTKQAIN